MFVSIWMYAFKRWCSLGQRLRINKKELKKNAKIKQSIMAISSFSLDNTIGFNNLKIENN